MFLGNRVAKLKSNFLRQATPKDDVHHIPAGKDVFGYDDADEIGTRSIRSEAAMGLFLMTHSTASQYHDSRSVSLRRVPS